MSTGGVGSQNLDTRLLRYRTRRGEENVVELADDLVSAGRGAEAQEVVAAALQARPEDAEMLLLDGRVRFATGDLLGAQASLLKAARGLPQMKEPFRWLGEVLLKRGDPSRAVKVLERAKAIDARDPTVLRLLERAARLARVADTAGAEAAAKEARDPQPDFDPPERTVIRSDLTEQLRSMTREVDGAPKTASGDTAVSREPAPYEAVPYDAVDEAETASASPFDEPFSDDFEDQPTNIVSGAALEEMARQQSAPARKPIPPKRRIKKTLTFGSPDAPDDLPVPGPPVTPPRPKKPLAPPPFGAAAPLPPKSSTSPGAAAAPVPPPPKRALNKPAPAAARPSADDQFAASDGEIDDALGALGGASSRRPSSPFEADDPFGADDPFAGAPSPPSSEPAPGAPKPLEAPAGDPFAAPAAFDDEDIDFADEPVLEPARGPAPEPLPPPGASADPFAAADAAEGTSEPVRDLSVGGGSTEDVDGILRMLQDEGLFEPPSGEAGTWAKRAEVRKTERGGTRIGVWIGAAWVLAAGLAVGGWYGWQAWVEHRHQEAARLVAQATEEAYGGDHADLVDAERHLREARDLDPHDRAGPTLMLFVHAQRALEDGAFDAGFLRPTIARAERLQMEDEDAELGAYLDAARAVLQAAEGGHEQARSRLQQALEARPRDPAILYVAGRLEQRLGGEGALEQLEAATGGEAELNAARLALAEARFDQGQAEEALALLDAILADDAEHLRARLWRAFMTSDTTEPDVALTALAELEPDVDQHGAPTDHVVMQLARARLLRRQGNGEAAGDAVDEALQAGASEPRLLALVATEGRRAGRLLHAEHAARTAVTGAPSNPDFRKLLAEIQLTRRNGRAALSTLAELDPDDPDVLEMRAAAALLLGSEEALTAAAEGLDAYVEAHEDASVEVRALRIRMHTALGQAREMLSEARALVEEVPGDPSAALALGETALRLYDAETAVESLQQVVQASPDDAEGHYLLGRARRMGGDAEGAEQALRRALELTPEHTDARLALGGLLLDMGQYQAADELYTELARSAGVAGGQALTVAGRLGRVEALTGLGSLDDAQVQLEALRDDVRETPSARITAARLDLARGRPGDALAQVRPLATAEGAAATVLALYGDALLAAGQGEPAAEAYEQALAQDAGSPEALLGQAEMAVRSEREDDALEILGRVERILEQRIRPPSMHARILTLTGRARLLAGRSQADAARDALRRAVALEGAPAEAQFWLGEALAGDNSPDSRAAYERYLELDPEGPYASRARRAIR